MADSTAEPFISTADRPLYVPVSPPRMPHIGHRHHLCHMSVGGDITLAQIKELVRNPKFICKKCGRVAAKEENLCEPVDL